MSQTGASADEWVPCGRAPKACWRSAWRTSIMKAGLRPADGAGRAGALVDGWSAGLPAFTPEAVEQETGVSAARIERLAREFASYGPAVAVIGGAPLAHTNGLAQALAVNALNALVGSVGAGRRVLHAAGAPRLSRRRARCATRWPRRRRRCCSLDDANPGVRGAAAWKVRDGSGRCRSSSASGRSSTRRARWPT